MLTLQLLLSSRRRIDAWGDASEAQAPSPLDRAPDLPKLASHGATSRAAKEAPAPLRECSLFDRITATISYGLCLRITRSEMRRREASLSIDINLCNIGSLPLTQLVAVLRPAGP